MRPVRTHWLLANPPEVCRILSLSAGCAAAKAGRQDLIVMGVSRRPGDRLFFGDTAATVLEEAPISIVFVAS